MFPAGGNSDADVAAHASKTRAGSKSSGARRGRLARDAEAEVERLNRLGELADRDVVDAGQRIGAGIIEADLAGDLHLGPTLHQRDRLADLSGREILEQ